MKQLGLSWPSSREEKPAPNYAQDEPACQGLTVKGPHVHSQSPEGRLEEVSAEPARRYKEQEQWQERERRQGVARNQKRGERIHALGRVLWSS